MTPDNAYTILRKSAADILVVEKETEGLLGEIVGEAN